MSKTLTHGKTDAQVTGDHARRIQAVERNLSLEQARYGIPALRDRLFLAAGASRGEQCRNYEPGFAANNLTPGSGARRYMAVYWPGGVVTGMTFILSTVGVYTDATPNSGGALYSYDGTTLTRQATQPQKWDATFSAGLNRLQWALPVNLVEGVYYVAIEYFESAHTTVPQFAAAAANDPSVWGGDVNQDASPSAWPLMFSSSGASGQLPTSIGSAALTTNSGTVLPYVGLY